MFLADMLGVKLDDITVFGEVAGHHRDVETTWGRVSAGTTAAVRFEVRGIVKGEPKIIVEHLNYTHVDVDAGWTKPVGPSGEKTLSQYTVIIEGEPNFTCRLDYPTTADAMMMIANHVVNAIPVVCAAKPGLLSVTDLPYYRTKAHLC